VRRDRLANGVTIIRAIRRHSGDPVVNLIQQWRHLRRIVSVLTRKYLRNDHAAACIHRQMPFAPFPARRSIM